MDELIYNFCVFILTMMRMYFKQFLFGVGGVRGRPAPVLWRERTWPWRLYLFGPGARQSALQVRKTVTHRTYGFRENQKKLHIKGQIMITNHIK